MGGVFCNNPIFKQPWLFVFFVISASMDSVTAEIDDELLPYLRKYKDGRIERLRPTEIVPAGVDPTTGVQSKDVPVAPEIGVSARLYLPKTADPARKLPILVYIHGGAFVIGSAFSTLCHTHLNSLVAEANVVAVSVDYRLAPEHPLPTAHDDSWLALKWVASHSDGNGPEPWLNQFADFQRLYMAGDSAGANIVHNMAIRVGSENPNGVNFKLAGIILNHPYFWGKESIGGEAKNPTGKAFAERVWHYVNPATTGVDDPLINPEKDPKLSGLGCNRVLICVAEKDLLRERGWYYKEVLKKSGWGGEVEIKEDKGVEHVFYLHNPTCEKAIEMVKRMALFLQPNKA